MSNIPKGTKFDFRTGKWITPEFMFKTELSGESLKINERGLILTPAIRIDVAERSIHVKNNTLDPQEIISGLLFWDRIDFPTSNFIDFGQTPEIDFLISEGIIHRSNATLMGGGDGAALTLAFLETVISDLSVRDPGRWTTVRGETGLVIVGGENKKDDSLQVRLHKAIPIPDGSVPFEEILEYKSRRHPELSALRNSIDKFHQQILSSPDRPIAEISAVDEIDAAVRDLLLASKENTFKQFISDISYNFAAPLIVFATASRPLDASTLILGVASGISVEKSLLTLKRPKQINAYEYAVGLHRELPWLK